MKQLNASQQASYALTGVAPVACTTAPCIQALPQPQPITEVVVTAPRISLWQNVVSNVKSWFAHN